MTRADRAPLAAAIVGVLLLLVPGQEGVAPRAAPHPSDDRATVMDEVLDAESTARFKGPRGLRDPF